MKICKDCKWFEPKQIGSANCASPDNGVDLITGEIQKRDPRLNRYNLEIIGCGTEGKFFKPKFEMDDDEHIASVFCSGGA